MTAREISTPPQAMAALAGYLRERLSEVSTSVTTTVAGTLTAALRRAELADRHGSTGRGASTGRRSPEHSPIAVVRHLAVAVVGAAAPFAPTSYARARLLRQMHATGLLTDEEVRRTATLIDAGRLPSALLDVPATVIDVPTAGASDAPTRPGPDGPPVPDHEATDETVGNPAED